MGHSKGSPRRQATCIKEAVIISKTGPKLLFNRLARTIDRGWQIMVSKHSVPELLFRGPVPHFPFILYLATISVIQRHLGLTCM